MRIVRLCSDLYCLSIACLRESVAIAEPLHASDDQPLVGLQATSTAFATNFQLLEGDAPQATSCGGVAGLAPEGPQPVVVLQRLASEIWTHGATMQISTLFKHILHLILSLQHRLVSSIILQRPLIMQCCHNRWLGSPRMFTAAGSFVVLHIVFRSLDCHCLLMECCRVAGSHTDWLRYTPNCTVPDWTNEQNTFPDGPISLWDWPGGHGLPCDIRSEAAASKLSRLRHALRVSVC